MKSNPLANILLKVSIAITDIETEIGELNKIKSPNDDLIEQLDYDRITLINISNILTPHLKQGIETKLKNIGSSDLYVDETGFELTTYHRKLTENELIEIADFLGMKLYISDIDLGYIHHWTNEESYDTEHYTRRVTI